MAFAYAVSFSMNNFVFVVFYTSRALEVAVSLEFGRKVMAAVHLEFGCKVVVAIPVEFRSGSTRDVWTCGCSGSSFGVWP